MGNELVDPEILENLDFLLDYESVKAEPEWNLIEDLSQHTEELPESTSEDGKDE